MTQMAICVNHMDQILNQIGNDCYRPLRTRVGVVIVMASLKSWWCNFLISGHSCLFSFVKFLGWCFCSQRFRAFKMIDAFRRFDAQLKALLKCRGEKSLVEAILVACAALKKLTQLDSHTQWDGGHCVGYAHCTGPAGLCSAQCVGAVSGLGAPNNA